MTTMDHLRAIAAGTHPADMHLSRAQSVPTFQPGYTWRDWLALTLIVSALLCTGFLVGRYSHASAVAQTATCIEGCPK